MTTPANDERMDMLERATEAIRRTPVPQMPSPETLRDLLTGAPAVPDDVPSTPHWRITHMRTITAIAASLLIALGIGYFALHGRTATVSAAYAGVLRPLLEVNSAEFTLTTPVDGKGSQTCKGMFIAPGRTRLEMANRIIVVDAEQGKMLNIEPAAKAARLVTFDKNAGQPARRFNVFAGVRKLLQNALSGGADVQPAEPREIGGVKASGYLVKASDASVKLWVNTDNLPLRMEVQAAGGTTVLSDITYNTPLDEGLFTLATPSGYALTQEDAQANFAVTGVVKDVRTGKAISGARVEDANYGPAPYKGANTDENGRYAFSTWSEEHRIVARAPGYSSAYRTVADSGGQTQMTIDFELDPEK